MVKRENNIRCVVCGMVYTNPVQAKNVRVLPPFALSLVALFLIARSMCRSTLLQLILDLHLQPLSN